MSIYIISDISFNNVNNAGSEASLERYNTALINKWNSIVSDDDKVLVFGNFARGTGSTIRGIINQLKGKIYIVQHSYNNFFEKSRWHKYGIDKVWNCSCTYTFKDNEGHSHRVYFPLEEKLKNPKSHEYICVRENYMDTVIQDNILNIGAKFWDYGPIKLEELPKIFERLKDFK